jgi:hypothetical protein
LTLAGRAVCRRHGYPDGGGLTAAERAQRELSKVSLSVETSVNLKRHVLSGFRGRTAHDQ